MGGANLVQNLAHVRGLLERGGRSHVHHVQHQRGFLNLLERGTKRLHQRGGQVADEADGVAEENAAARGQQQRADGGIERGEQPRVGEHAGLGEPVEKGGLSGVGVAGERERGQRNRAAAAPVDGAAGAHALQIELDLLNAMGDAAPVGFELRFARPAGAYAAAQPRHLDAVPGEARQQVIELRQFDLEAAFARAGARGEDVEDQLGAVDNAAFESIFRGCAAGWASVRDRR